MKHVTLFSGKRLFLRLALAATMIVFGGEKVWADTVIFGGGSVSSDWTYHNGSGSSATFSNLAMFSYSSSAIRYCTSNKSDVEITAGQTIVISAKKYSEKITGVSIKVKYSSDNGDTWTTAEEFAPTDHSNYAEFVVDDLVGTYKIEFEFSCVYINSIIIKDALTTPILSVSGDSIFGYVTENTTHNFTVKNTGAGSMDVNITSSDAAFNVLSSSLTGITNDGVGQTFGVRFNYDSRYPKPHYANITITPTSEGADPKTIAVSAGPDVVFDEDSTTTWTTGFKSVYVNYSVRNGWNTICFPVAPSADACKNGLFGSSATVSAYHFSSYSEGTLTFESSSYMAAGTPYLVFVKDAGSESFVISDIYVGYTSGNKATHDGVTFQGTFAPKAAGSLDGCYGVTESGQIAKAGSGTKMKGYRAYLTGIPDGSSVKMFVIDGDDATDVGLMQMVEGEDKAVYNISGQRVQKARKGLYIIGGKKVIIK